ncbi:conserved Plasmodium protein, unknown function [Plasmodium berghei]|uniref:Uncharacterized protein n=2 Tax=Plasmodium berghei TaxID=5821 RepID=A0A509AG86_PLABA|nr:conserved Plasmodium protein, unknown function [Plasmodium berghei ANKA]CXH81934.1 conserved Plasmodium protein, unknown function [Plasmodium berghei]SCM19160.1 conserved Plasmodium protein, unknown function [Plasmodium berghei]SCO58865.1 conserved Plasmodium protein, unknown function [Plasmodium berghei]VUC53811.1 conserved Plasmodium protein, unknown function [Plasmodium berghei ANKA]|eukprot:XP_034419675.1 conserved Plasmodium protein, unknown function [Plasmodium berghei ANKA]
MKELNMDEYYLHKKEIKNIFKNDGEDISTFIITKKMALTKERNDNIKDMKNLISKYPYIFVKSSILYKELENNVQNKKTIIEDVNIIYNKITELFQSDEYKKDVKDLNYLTSENVLSNNIFFSEIFKIPLLIHKYINSNEHEENLPNCIKYIKLCCNIKPCLHQYCYNNKFSNDCLVNYLKSYEQTVNKQIKKIKKIICNLIVKTNDVDKLKLYIQYLSDIFNYFNTLKFDENKIDHNYTPQNVVGKQDEIKSLNCSEKSSKLANYNDNNDTGNISNNVDHIIDNHHAIDKNGEEYIKNKFLKLKHYNILTKIRERLFACENNRGQATQKKNLHSYEILQLFLNEILKLKNIYQKLFNGVDTNLYKHIAFIYYFALSLVHIKITQGNSPRLNENNDVHMHTSNIRLLNKLNERIVMKKNKTNSNYSNDNNNINSADCYKRDDTRLSNSNLKLPPEMEKNYDFMYSSKKKKHILHDITKFMDEFNKNINEENILDSYFFFRNNNISTWKYPFLNLNTCIFNYMYYYVFFKNKKKLFFKNNEKKNSSKKKVTNIGFQEKKSFKNHYNFVEYLYEEEDKKYDDVIKNCPQNIKKDFKKKSKKKNIFLNHYIAIQSLIQNNKIKETVLDLQKYRKHNLNSLILKEDNANPCISFSIVMDNFINKIFVAYIYDFLQANNNIFYQNILFFDKGNNNEKNDSKEVWGVETNRLPNSIDAELKKQREFFIKNAKTFFDLNKNRTKEINENEPKNSSKFSQEHYQEKIAGKLKYSFLISYFYNIIFILKTIKCYIDKSLLYTIIHMFEISFKNIIENLITMFLATQNIFFKYNIFQFIIEALLKSIFPFAFLFLSCIYQIDVTRLTEKILKTLNNYSISI